MLSEIHRRREPIEHSVSFAAFHAIIQRWMRARACELCHLKTRKRHLAFVGLSKRMFRFIVLDRDLAE